MTIEDLATMTQNGFREVDKRFDKVEERLDRIENILIKAHEN
jgi:tetrahydromethanopterin S-methyltransferase subunit G